MSYRRYFEKKAEEKELAKLAQDLYEAGYNMACEEMEKQAEDVIEDVVENADVKEEVKEEAIDAIVDELENMEPEEVVEVADALVEDKGQEKTAAFEALRKFIPSEKAYEWVSKTGPTGKVSKMRRLAAALVGGSPRGTSHRLGVGAALGTGYGLGRRRRKRAARRR